MRIAKVKWDGERVELKYEVERDEGGTDEYTLKCKDEPLPEFREAFAELSEHAAEICGLPTTGISVLGVTFSQAKDEREGATISAKKTLMKYSVPLCFNTPHLPFEPHSEGGDCLDEDCVMALERLRHCAERYAEGKRAQGALFEAA